MRRVPLAVVACAGLVLVVTIIVSSAHHADSVKGVHGGTIELTSAEARGRELFAAHCSSCHTLHAVNAVADVGPDLDFVRPSAPVVRRRVHQGSNGLMAVMPPEIVTGSDAADVAAFVSKVAGR